MTNFIARIVKNLGLGMKMYLLPADADSGETFQVSDSHGSDRIAEAWITKNGEYLNVWVANKKYKGKIQLALPVHDSIEWFRVEEVVATIEKETKE